MHSSRRRTVRSSSHLPRRCLPGGVSVQEGCLLRRGVCPGGCLPGRCLPKGVCIPAYTGTDTPSPVDRILDTHLLKHYLFATTLPTIKITRLSVLVHLSVFHEISKTTRSWAEVGQCRVRCNASDVWRFVWTGLKEAAVGLHERRLFLSSHWPINRKFKTKRGSKSWNVGLPSGMMFVWSREIEILIYEIEGLGFIVYVFEGMQSDGLRKIVVVVFMFNRPNKQQRKVEIYYSNLTRIPKDTVQRLHWRANRNSTTFSHF